MRWVFLNAFVTFWAFHHSLFSCVHGWTVFVLHLHEGGDFWLPTDACFSEEEARLRFHMSVFGRAVFHNHAARDIVTARTAFPRFGLRWRTIRLIRWT